MDSLNTLYDQYNGLITDSQENIESEVTTNLLQYSITKDYFDRVSVAVELLKLFYERHLTNKKIQDAISARYNDHRKENVKFSMLIDIIRCYDGLDHPMSFNSPEGIALMVLLDRIIGLSEIERYEQLGLVSSTTLGLIDIIPYIKECSIELGDRFSLFMPTIYEQICPDIDYIYRRLIYKLCKLIVEVDGVISVSEKDWLNEITLLNDDNPDNDIDIGGL